MSQKSGSSTTLSREVVEYSDPRTAAFRATLDRLPDEIALAIGLRIVPDGLGDGHTCVCGWAVREAIAREVNADAESLEAFKAIRRCHEKYRFTVDAAASADNALLPRFWTMADDGLDQSWAMHRVWCNPPYSDLEPWVKKAWSETLDVDCPLVVMLVPANRCEQGWWQRHIERHRDRPCSGVTLRVEFLPGRMRFNRPSAVIGPKGDRPPFGCALLIWSRPSLKEGSEE